MIELVWEVANEQSAVPIDEALLQVCRRAAESVLRAERLEGRFELSLSLVDKPAIQHLNHTYRGIDRVTDVLSFPLGEAGALERHPVTGTVLLGDIVICAPRAVEQAEEYGHSVQREFGFLCAHSVLHLLGYDHVGSAEEAAVMEMKQHEALESIGLLRE